ncbi:MAG TPA: hypothetical protein VGI98_03330 [Candidatus Limnocylindrales bacterium]|jgi:hypothetical protein
MSLDPGLRLVPTRRLLGGPVDAGFDLHPGDVVVVADGQAVSTDAPLADRLRDARTAVVAGPADGDDTGVPGGRWLAAAGRRGRETDGERAGELLFRSGGRWRIGTGEHPEPLVAPFAGVVHEVRPGTSLRLRSAARGLPGVETLAGPTSGRLTIVTGPDGEVRAPHVDVSAAGAILVAGARIDAEALTRARAVGVRGIVVAALGVKERRDFLASERRGRAAVHGLPPFAILVLDGAAGRPIASPVMAILRALEGRTVALIGDPPCLVVDDPAIELPAPPDDLVWVRSGPLVGAEGRWAGLAGPRRFPGGVTLEAGLVRFGDRPPIAVPLGDLERFV